MITHTGDWQALISLQIQFKIQHKHISVTVLIQIYWNVKQIIRTQQTELPDYPWKCMTGYMRLDILHCDALVNNQLLLHIVCFFVVGSLNSTVVNQLHHAQCTSTFFSILKPNCLIECTSPHNLCAIHGHADNKCNELVWDPKVFFFKHRTWFLSWHSTIVNCSH